jgi:hypothetical protein
MDNGEITPNVAFQVFVSVFNNCNETPTFKTDGLDMAVVLPLFRRETPEAERSIAEEPIFTMVMTEPIGNATDAFVGIVMVCPLVLAEYICLPASSSTSV